MTFTISDVWAVVFGFTTLWCLANNAKLRKQLEEEREKNRVLAKAMISGAFVIVQEVKDDPLDAEVLED